jgi:hypothetical protein
MSDQYHRTRRSILRKAVTTSTIGGLAVGGFAGGAGASKNSTLRVTGLENNGYDTDYAIHVDDKYGEAGGDTESDDNVRQDDNAEYGNDWDNCYGNTEFNGHVINGGTDTYHYNGSILTIGIRGAAEVEVDNDPYSSRNNQEGEIHVYDNRDSGDRSDYEFCMTDEVSPDCGIGSADSTSAECADGSVNGGSDYYNAAGEISVFRIYGDINAYHYYEQEPSCWGDDDQWKNDC